MRFGLFVRTPVPLQANAPAYPLFHTLQPVHTLLWASWVRCAPFLPACGMLTLCPSIPPLLLLSHIHAPSFYLHTFFSFFFLSCLLSLFLCMAWDKKHERVRQDRTGTGTGTRHETVRVSGDRGGNRQTYMNSLASSLCSVTFCPCAPLALLPPYPHLLRLVGARGKWDRHGLVCVFLYGSEQALVK